MGAKLLLILARKLLQSCRASETCLKKNLSHRSQVQYKQIDCSIAIHLDSQSRIYTVSMQQICSDGIVDALVNVSYRYFCRLKLTELRSSLQSLLEAAFVLICFNAKKTTCFTGNCLGMLQKLRMQSTFVLVFGFLFFPFVVAMYMTPCIYDR